MKKILHKLLKHRRNLFAVSLGQVLAAAGAFFGVRLVTEYVPPAVFGEYKLILAGISLIVGIFIRPFTQFMMREYHDAEKIGQLDHFIYHVRSISFYYLLLLAMAVAVFVLLFPPGLIPASGGVLLASLAVFSLQPAVEFERALMVTRNKQIQAGMVNVARNWFVPIAITISILQTSTTALVMLSATVAVLIVIYIIQRYVSRQIGIVKHGERKLVRRSKIIHNAFRYGLPLAPVGLLSWLVHESDRFFLSYYHSEEVVGIYSAAYGLVAAPFTLIVGAMVQFLYPIMFRVSATENRKKKMDVVKALLGVSIVVALLGVCIIGMFKNQIAWLALGESYREGATELMFWVALGYGFVAVSSSFDLAAHGEKKTSDMFFAYSIAAIANLSLNIMLIPGFGAMGAVIATSISLFLYLLAMACMFFYRYSFWSKNSSDVKCK